MNYRWKACEDRKQGVNHCDSFRLLCILLFFGFISKNVTAQCDSALYKYECNPMEPMPTIYMIGTEAESEEKAINNRRYNGNDCRYQIMRVNSEYIDYLVDEACKNGNYGKQRFMVVNTLQEAYDVQAWCKPFIPYDIIACDN